MEVNIHDLITRMFDHILDFSGFVYRQGMSMFHFFGTPVNQQGLPNDIEDFLILLGFTLEETPFEICFGPLLFFVFFISVIKTLTSVIPTP